METTNSIRKFVVVFTILTSIPSSYQAVGTGKRDAGDEIEPGYLFAKFATRLSDINFRVSRRSANAAFNSDNERSVQGGSCGELRGDVSGEIGPWPGARRISRAISGGNQPNSRAKSEALTVSPSTIFNNSDLGNLLKTQCKSAVGFPECYGDKTRGDDVLQEAVTDYGQFSEKWLPDCKITRECAKIAGTGRVDWFASRWQRLSMNRSSSLPVCYDMADLRELSPERLDAWWFDFCCFSGSICEPFSTAGDGWGKLLVRTNASASYISKQLELLHDTTCTANHTRSPGLESCVTDVILAWNILNGPTSPKIRSGALATLVRCDPDLWMNPVRTFEAALNRLTDAEIQTIHSMFDGLISAQRGTTAKHSMNTFSSGTGPIMTPHEFQMGPRAVSGIVVVIILIVLSLLVGLWAAYQKINTWRHPRSNIQYAPIYMQDDDDDDFLDGGSSQGDLDRIQGWSRVEDLGPDSDPETGPRGGRYELI